MKTQLEGSIEWLGEILSDKKYNCIPCSDRGSRWDGYGNFDWNGHFTCPYCGKDGLQTEGKK